MPALATSEVGLLDQIAGFIVVLTPEGVVMNGNRAWERLTGLTLEGVRGRAFWQLLTSADEAATVRQALDTLAARDPCDFETTWPTQAAGRRTIAFTAALVRDAAGAPASICLTGIEVTGLVRAREAGVTQLRVLLEQAPDGIFVADLDGRYTDVNDAGCRMLGYTRDEIVRKTIVDLIPPTEVERLLESKREMLAGRTHVAEWTLRRKDQSLLPVEVSARILPDGRWQGLVRDISERITARAQLDRARERLDLALRGADLAAWDWNVKTGEVVYNSRWAEMRGHRPDDVRPHIETWLAGVHPEDLPHTKRVLAEHLEGRTPEYETEHRVKTRSGEWIWILDRGKVFERDQQGQPTRMAGTELDITRRKRLENELRLAEAKASGIVSLSIDAIVSMDERQRITLFNESAERIFGHARHEVLGRPIELLFPERFRDAHRRHVESFAAGNEVARPVSTRKRTVFGLRKDGSEFPAEAAISKFEVDGQWVLTVVLRDITEQRRVASQQNFLAEVGPLLASSLEYEEILTKVAEAAVEELADVCVVDIIEDDGEVRRLKVVSRDPDKAWACDLLTRVRLDRTRPTMVQSPLQSRRTLLIERLSAEQLASFAQSEDHLRALRGLAPSSVIAVPLLARGELLGAIALLSSTPARPFDAADVRLAEELARRAALSIANGRLYRASRRASQERDDVLGVVAHDLRNPLNTIVLQTSVLQRKWAVALPDLRNPACAIERAVHRMNRLIQDLLDVTRLDAGHLVVERAPVATTQIVLDALEAERALAESAALDLRVELGSEVPDVLGDRDRLLQVFENLSGNAIKFTPPGGSVTIGASPKDGEVLFWVSDSGPGIAQGDLAHLFDRFWQGHKGHRAGAGLGLPIAKGIVEAHGGRIWVESTPGRGSTFLFTIPAIRENC